MAYRRTRLDVTYQDLIRVVRTHPSLVPEWHVSHRRVKAVEMPMQMTIIARNDAPAAYSVLANEPGGSSPCSFGGWSCSRHVRRKGRCTTSMTENGIAVPVFQPIWLTILELTMSAEGGMSEDLKLWQRYLLEAGYFHFRVIYIGTFGTSGDCRRTLDFNTE